MSFFGKWLLRWKRRNALAIGYRFAGAPTSEEVAASAGWAAVPVLDPSLTRDQVRRLVELIEECAEAQHAAIKVLWHGWDDRSRGGKGFPGRVVLERELGHVLAAVASLYGPGQLRLREVKHWERCRAFPQEHRNRETAAGQ